MNKDIASLYEKIAQCTFNSLPKNFSGASLTAKMIARYIEVTGNYVTRENEVAKSFLPDEKVEPLLEKLRESMAALQPGKGAWYTATLDLNSEGEFSFKFDYDNSPDFQYKPSQDKFDEDAKKFPRT
ncbi:immunity protein YezG family protein [Dyella sp. RRB7]|uniref:immunity protein YezG family protein n=1 Tax=Dyella sp. RRB7 TaxID=2919502 RepID=UPI001FA9A954|nr:immunity protein YezG family protein [Dyella sp. RRB7]